jgi:hypothetical protein
MIAVFERAKSVPASDRAATVIGSIYLHIYTRMREQYWYWGKWIWLIQIAILNRVLVFLFV